MATDYDLLVLNGIVVTDTDTGEYDVAVKGEKIANIVSRGGLSGAVVKQTIDAQGGYVMVRFKTTTYEIC